MALSYGRRRLEAPLKVPLVGWVRLEALGRDAVTGPKASEERMQAGEGLEEMKVMINIPKLP